MPVVRVLPANSESAVVDIHDEHDLPLQGMSLMMCENASINPSSSTAVADIHD